MQSYQIVTLWAHLDRCEYLYLYLYYGRYWILVLHSYTLNHLFFSLEINAYSSVHGTLVPDFMFMFSECQ